MAEETPPLRVLLADDHVTVRHGLKLLIEEQPDMIVVAEVSDGDTAVQRTLAMKPDVVVMDISMPGMNGLVATRLLKQQHSTTGIVTLTRHADDAYLVRDGRKPSGGQPSEREIEVLRLIAAGYSNKEIAARLSLSVKTVEAHKANAMRKLGLTGRIDIVKYAVLQGWLTNA
jgi:two-component system response regulator NreC